jgi:hypothetical protein
MKKELLSIVIVMTLKEFRSMLLGAKLTAHTNYNNLTFNNLQTQQVIRWRCYVEGYSPVLKYIEGPKNAIADTFSRLHGKEGKSGAEVEVFNPFVTNINQQHDKPPNTIEDN